MSRKVFSNFDVFAIIKELDLILSGGTISNLYAVEDIIILKINTHLGKKNLIVKKDSRINLTNYEYPIPKYPTQYIMNLRKFLKNKRILNISQYKFDRVVIIELGTQNNDNVWKIIVELFNKGNFVLMDDQNIVKVAKKYKKFRNRAILANKKYEYPESFGLNFLSVNKEEFHNLLKTSENEIVRVMARNINIAGVYSEEICYRADIDKNLLSNKLNEIQIEKLYTSFKSLRNDLLFGEIKAQIIYNEINEQVSVVPFDMRIYEDYENKYFESFNEAVDIFFSKLDSQELIPAKDSKVKNKINAQEKILDQQINYLGALKKKKEKYYEFGDFIYAHFTALEKLLNVISNAQIKGYNWEEISKKLTYAKKENMNGAEFFKKIIPSNKTLIIKINGKEINLNLNKTIGENANEIYRKGKKAKKKIQGTIEAIDKTKKKIKTLKEEKASLENKIDFLVKKPKKKWYEKYRWFKSSNRFLVIGGRDASSNEAIFKKYLNPTDLVFHTNFPGSPLVIIKNPENETIPEQTIIETATFTASYSQAWKESWGIADVFYVTPDQVSKSPPTGEFLPRGSFMISGKKNILRKVKTELAVGLIFIEREANNREINKIFYPKIICGPTKAISNQCDSSILKISPSKSGLSVGKLAKKIKSFYVNDYDSEMKNWVDLLSLDDIILVLPPGNSNLKQI
ncbi:MAG: DUF814 domain-containing protein [Candidatus Lokiarchaeota archaeon]|nr:DUF814 domain-containing protein [Candidatus Lokiarchaeota archaeon]